MFGRPHTGALWRCFRAVLFFRQRLFECKDCASHWWTFRHHHELFDIILLYLCMILELQRLVVTCEFQSYFILWISECTEFDLTCFVTFLFRSIQYVLGFIKFYMCSSHLKINLIIYFSRLIFDLCSHFSNLNSCFFFFFWFLIVFFNISNIDKSEVAFFNVNKKKFYYYFSCHVSFKCVNKAKCLSRRYFPLVT